MSVVESIMLQIETSALAEAILAGSETIKIIDVRSESDFALGHIKNAENYPSENWNDFKYVVDFVALNIFPAMQKGLKQVIFLCGRSRNRGPNAAKAFLNSLGQTNASNDFIPEV
jgi:rhodanese-related sulfurtransferase